MYQSLQAGRAVAASLVVLFHLGGTFAQDRYFGLKALDGPFAWGDAGVEFFFVLSGFLITITHRADFSRPETFPRYVSKRLLRIYPTYWFICLAVCAAALVAPALRQALSSDPMVLLKAFALVPQDPAVVGGTGAPILFVAWSLQYEMLFYGVVGLAVLNRWAGACAALGLLAVHASCRFGSDCSFPRSFVANNLVFVFAMGVAGAYLLKSRFQCPRPLGTGLLAVLAFVGFGIFEIWQGRENLPVDRRLVYGAIGAVIILAFAQAEDRGVLRLRHPLIKILGDSSYALYLLHIPLISLLAKLGVRLGISGPLPTIAAFVFVFLACVVVAIAFHLTIERRLLALFRPRRRAASARRPADFSVATFPQASPADEVRRPASAPLRRTGSGWTGGPR